MTTDNSVRSINELLSCTTYQGMTDAEITRLIEWNRHMALTEAKGAAALNQLNEEREWLMAMNAEDHATLHDMVESVLRVQLTLGVIPDGQA